MITRRRARCLAVLALVATVLPAAGSAYSAGESDPGLKSLVRETKPDGYAAAANPSFPDGPLPLDLLTSATNTRSPEGMVGYGVI